jgi:tellurite methyltransferase
MNSGNATHSSDPGWWDERYSAETDWFFGRDPSELGRLTLHFWRMIRGAQGGRLLDLGCGEGRDSVYFAANGFQVTAIDLAQAGVRKALRLAGECGVALDDLRCADVRTAPLEDGFDVVFSGNCIQALGGECPQFLSRIQASTPVDGFNAIRVATSETDAFADRPGLYRFAPRELLADYEGWRILYYSEDLLYVPHAGGLASFAGVIAQKAR